MADDLTIREVLDQLRTYYAKQVKPFEKLPQVIEAAVQIIEMDLPAARRELSGVMEQLTVLRASKPDVEIEVATAQARVKTAQDEAAMAEREAQRRINAAAQMVEIRETRLTRDFDEKQAGQEREFTHRREALTAEITALEAKKTALEEAIAAVRAKF